MNRVPGQDGEGTLILPSSSRFLLLLPVGQQAQLNHQLFSETGQFLLGEEQKTKCFIFSASSLPSCSLVARAGLMCVRAVWRTGLGSSTLGLNPEEGGQALRAGAGHTWTLSQPVTVDLCL